jgi:MraZ protein
MFLGKYAHTLDEKGRLTLPAKFRARLVDGLVLTSGIEKCLVVYPMEAFQPLFEKVSALSMADLNANILRRKLFEYASDIVPDKQNRVLLPQELRDYAGISSEAIVVGVGKWIEIWGPDGWKAQQALIAAQSENLEALVKLGV